MPTYDSIVDAGWTVWPILGLSVLAALVGVAGVGAALRASTRGGAVVVPALTLVLGCTVGGAGVVGHLHILDRTEYAAAHTHGLNISRYLAGREAAQLQLVLAGLGAAPALALGLAGLGIAAARKLDSATRDG